MFYLIMWEFPPVLLSLQSKSLKLKTETETAALNPQCYRSITVKYNVWMEGLFPTGRLRVILHQHNYSKTTFYLDFLTCKQREFTGDTPPPPPLPSQSTVAAGSAGQRDEEFELGSGVSATQGNLSLFFCFRASPQAMHQRDHLVWEGGGP